MLLTYLSLHLLNALQSPLLIVICNLKVKISLHTQSHTDTKGEGVKSI